MKKIPRQEYTAELKELAVKRVKGCQSAGAVAKDFGLVEQTLRNWVKAAASSKLNGAGAKVVTPEQMELSRLRAENVRLKREILKNDGVLHERNAVKYAWIDAQRHGFSLYDLPIAPNLLERNFTRDAPSKNWFGSLKNERVYAERFETRDEMTAMAFEYIEVFYNRKRLLSTPGYKSPVQFLADWFYAKKMKNW